MNYVEKKILRKCTIDINKLSFDFWYFRYSECNIDLYLGRYQDKNVFFFQFLGLWMTSSPAILSSHLIQYFQIIKNKCIIFYFFCQCDSWIYHLNKINWVTFIICPLKCYLFAKPVKCMLSLELHLIFMPEWFIPWWIG